MPDGEYKATCENVFTSATHRTSSIYIAAYGMATRIPVEKII